MQPQAVKPRSIYLVLSVIMIGLVLAVFAVLVAYNLYNSQRRMQLQASDLFERVGREAVAVIEGELRPARITASLLAATPLIYGTSQAERLGQVPLLAGALRANSSLSAAYGGVANGSFVLLRSLATPALRQQFQAPDDAVFLLQAVDRDDDRAKGSYTFYDADLRPLRVIGRPDYSFDPRIRPWFAQAVAAASQRAVAQTPPYVFFSTGEVGVTLARAGAAPHAQAAAGVDVSLQALSRTLALQKVTPSTELMIVDDKGAVLAYSKAQVLPAGARRLPLVDELGSPVLRQLWHRGPPAPGSDSVEQSEMRVDGQKWVVRLEPLKSLELVKGVKDQRLMLAIASPRDELQAQQIRARHVTLAITAGLTLLMLPVAIWTAGLVSRPLWRLALEAEAIRRFELDGPDPERSLIREIDQLSVAMTRMKHSLRRFLEISSALSGERNFEQLLDRILVETISVTEASGGALHLLSSDGLWLEPAGSRLDGEPGTQASLNRWRIDDADSPAAAVQALRQDRTVELAMDWQNPAHLAAYGALFDKLKASRFRLLALPLKNRQNELIGTLSLSFVVDGLGESVRLTPARVAFIEALSGTAAVAIDNQQLLRAQKDLLESFIQLVAGSIDAKSPYTGAHCQRVPELTKMLARAACEATSGPFADFNLNAEQWEALHIGAWLHDCGKVTTPEFVVDKATKLETLYDRIHEVRMRFELLKRDAQIALLVRGRDAAELARLQEELAPVWAKLDEEFAFVAACNEGGEFMAPEKVARLHEIAARIWWRTLDNRQGLSIDEKKRMGEQPRETLPVREQLLADNPEHVVPRPAEEHMPADNRWGFQLKEPTHLYNRGELYNLSIARGTLSDEERYKINDHIVQTIRMLESLPFPRHLRRVPEIAGGHHEKMDGSGYPRRLTREQMSVEARMMAVADVFEALTADDRPYKKGKKLSEALKIMSLMRRDQHIDAELFELFLRAGIHLEYARCHMHPDQLDAVNIEDYLS